MTSEAMPARSGAPRRHRGRVRTSWTTIRAVLTRELRWRMRGRRAFVIATVFVLLLGFISFGIYQLLVDQAAERARWRFEAGVVGALPVDTISGDTSVRIGQAIFGGMLAVLTVLILMVAPALTSAVISSEREKQTMELLVTTPISTLGLVVGKLFGALAYVLLLVVASLPLMALVFAFGGIAPEDVARAYVLLLAIAFGMGSIGMFLSALVGRTQIATVVSYIVVLALTLGTFAVHSWLWVTSDRGDGFQVDRSAPEVLLWLNPVAADIDILCTAMPESGPCFYTNLILGVDDDPPVPPRDAFWPRAALSLFILGCALTLLTTQLISSSRRFRWRRRTPPAPEAPASGPAATP